MLAKVISYLIIASFLTIYSGAHEHDVGAIRADHPLRMDRVVSYFEVRIIDTGRKGAIAVGLVDSTYSFMRHPGHESHSYGYHGDDGKKYSDGKGENYGQICSFFYHHPSSLLLIQAQMAPATLLAVESTVLVEKSSSLRTADILASHSAALLRL
jgi:hypothetical protein